MAVSASTDSGFAADTTHETRLRFIGGPVKPMALSTPERFLTFSGLKTPSARFVCVSRLTRHIGHSAPVEFKSNAPLQRKNGREDQKLTCAEIMSGVQGL